MVPHGREGIDKIQNPPLRRERTMSHIWSHTRKKKKKQPPKWLDSKINSQE